MGNRKLFFNPVSGIFRFDCDFGEIHDIPENINWQFDDGINVKKYGFKNLTLNLTMDCNLKCKYCWQDHNCSKDMDLEIIDKWLDFFLDERLNSPKKILYFGGEPLLRLDLIRYCTNKVDLLCKQKEIKKPQQQIFTNATLLTDEAISLIKKEDIYLILSIDGNDEINAKYRLDKSGNSVQQLIHCGIQKLHQEQITFGVCSTMSDMDFDVDKTIRYILEEIRPASIEFNIRYDRGFMKKYESESKIPFDSFFQAWDLIRKAKVENVNFKKRVLPLAFQKPLRNSSSGSKNKLAIMPNGNVSPFNSAVQFSELQIQPVGDWFVGFRNQWNRNLLKNEKCKNCEAAFICGQGSAFSSYLEYGDFLHTPFLHCEYCNAVLSYVKKTLTETLDSSSPENHIVSKEEIIRIFNL